MTCPSCGVREVGRLEVVCELCAVVTHPEKVAVDDATGCWNWTGAISTSGYGKQGDNYAHRIVYRRAVAGIPAGYDVDHLCRNKRCCNPKHLEAVPHRVNNCRGKSAKLSHEIVLEMRRLRECGWNNCQIGRHFGVHNATVSRAVRGESWEHVGRAVNPEHVRTIVPRVMNEIDQTRKDAA